VQRGQRSQWDVTVSDTLAQSQGTRRSRHQTRQQRRADERKTNKYTSLAQSYLFVPVAAETMEAINKDFLSHLGRRITQSTDDHRKSAFLFQRLSINIAIMESLSWLPSVRATRWRHGRAGAADTGVMERAEWAEPGTMTDSY